MRTTSSWCRKVSSSLAPAIAVGTLSTSQRRPMRRASRAANIVGRADRSFGQFSDYQREGSPRRIVSLIKHGRVGGSRLGAALMHRLQRGVRGLIEGLVSAVVGPLVSPDGWVLPTERVPELRSEAPLILRPRTDDRQRGPGRGRRTSLSCLTIEELSEGLDCVQLRVRGRHGSNDAGRRRAR
jgi:hypothetical protein